MGETLLAVYLVCMSLILMYSLAQAHLLWLSLKSGKSRATVPRPLPTLPRVTVQLPVYNEPLVIERLIAKVAELDYPKDLLEIQVLDDSDDGTELKAASAIAELQSQGLDIIHLRRDLRSGFKAGALAQGMSRAKGEFIAIFDADFLPEKDFLLRTIHHFSDSSVGVVQTRWGHLNRNCNLLTRLLAMTLDVHFRVEQAGRGEGGNFLNFNGTAGIWRKECIGDAGGWRADSLTEDLDLSYRAQLKGWGIRYLNDVVAPAEVPMLMPAIRSQQYRWNKGGAEVARLHLGRVLRSGEPLHVKAHAVFHLLNTAVFICVALAALVSVPLLLYMDSGFIRELSQVMGIFLVAGFLTLGAVFWAGSRDRFTDSAAAGRHFILHFPLFVAMSMGLSLFNSIAVMEGYAGRRTPFVRTPKFASVGADAHAGRPRWGLPSAIAFAEGLLAVYFIGGIGLAIMSGVHLFLLFHLLLAVGFGMVASYSALHAKAE